ncbi:phycoerythrobilin:Cys-82 alpha-phycoerythrin lyase/ CpeY subunit [Synechococcus sp. BIOS-E4-1]|uniref:HEAT repeat domain-containing protein n=1 Tax=Synechococcus sp. BIOS-E4-1 TaxID=1400864 RepID=UPI0003B0A90C|nr:bilin biosynthesis protein CpeY [Synechococcus sp. BIOS-E4-1]AGW21725.1 phycoerythrobilin:Cys-82 alpha-phycoerythrin lyase CpeY subunit [Synechococcus sp. BIOS-E4-1]QNI53159.1 phycoerythrobilin:Cys-82 alpha-phycoerythrin lyase/ CpeY subunit [Synechococcus sp. BIOS-E4-1]
MTGRFDNIHPELTCEHARQILLRPINELESQSDYYMAASHLINCPGSDTEQALVDLLENPLNEQAVNIAKRKAVEVLGRLGAESSISVIGRCLWSDDRYLVENTVCSLRQLKCNQTDLIAKIINLLKDDDYNQRVLIQCLASLSVQESLTTIQVFKNVESPGIRGAAIAADAQLTGCRKELSVVADHLLLPNQMDRQCAIQDLIDAQAVEQLPAIVSSPVSPTFRVRACRLLLNSLDHSALVESMHLVDAVLIDNPSDINIVHEYDVTPGLDFLVRDLFNTDFSRCYLAMKTLSQMPSQVLWPVISREWEEEAHNDYGAHYFFMRLIGSRSDWPQQAVHSIDEILKSSAINMRPQFQKSRPAAMYSMAQWNPDSFLELMPMFLSDQYLPAWDCRYVAILALESISSQANQAQVEDLLKSLVDDDDCFVQARLASIRLA